MKRWLWYVVLGVGFVIAAQSSVYALDPPHSLNSAVDCGECHGEGLFQTDPSTMAPEELQQAYNDMCKRCHVSNDGSYNATDSPRVEPHNSNVVNGDFTFQTSCTDCHHPHLQTPQMYWGRRTAGSPGQLFKGLVTTIKYFNAAHDQEVSKELAALTEVTYDLASLVVKAGSVWDTTDGLYPPTGDQLEEFPDGVPGEPVDIETGLHNLEHKMYKLHEKPGRGAIFLPFYRSHYNGRIIQSIDTDADTITFKGTVPSNYEGYMTNPAYGFAIYLGLAVNIQVRHIKADSARPVYLFDRTGPYGFGHQDYCEPEYTDVTDCTDSTPSGLCQACHTLTDFYKSDGTGLSHYNGSDCMECHAHHLGFKSASTVDHTGTTIGLVRSPAQCTACHDPGGNTAYVFDIHQENCDACHVNGQDLRLDYGTPPPESAVVLSIDGSDCVDCHENGTTVTYLTDFDNLTSGHQVADHSGMTGNTGATTVTTSCYTATYCHYAPTKVDIAEVIHSDCTDCHVNTGNDGRLIDGPNNYGDATVHVIYSTISTCDVCHLADGYFDSHTHPVHDSVHRDGTDQSNGSDCEACHQTNNDNDLNTWTDILVEHQNSCILCHDATRDINPLAPTGITVQDRIAFGSGNKVSPTGCLHCHADRSATHMPDHKLTGMVTGSTTNCVPCHDPSGLDNENHYLLTVHTACGVCHVTGTGGDELWNYGPSGLNTGGTIDEYVNYEGIDANPDPTYEGGTCTDCHVNYSNDFGSEHQVVSHTYIDGNGNCISCHANDIITVVHSTAGCTDCHVNSTTNGSLVTGTDGDAQLHTMGATSDCAKCHGATGGFNYDSNFGGAHTNVDHKTKGGAADAVTISSACTNTCHAQNTAADIITITHKDNCLDCHNNTDSDGTMHVGDIVGSIADAISYGTAADHGFDTTSSCVDCHENGSTYTYLSDYGGANGHQVMDHDGITGTTSGTPIYDCNNCHAAATKIQIAQTTHTACSNCHNSSGDLVGAVTNGTTLNHVMGQTSNCVECHGVSGGDYDTNFENHIYANDTTDHIAPPDSGSTVFQLAGTDEISGTKCDACHGSTLTDWANVYDLHNVGAGACATCHNSTRDYDTDDGGSVQTVIHDNNQSTNPCISCHYSYRLDHSDHVATGWVYGNAECTGCHDQAGAADQDQYIVVLHNNSCDMCHTDSGNSDYTLKVGTSAYGHDLGTTNTCSDCHDGSNGQLNYAGDFTLHTAQNHTWVGSNIECSECHTGDIVNLDAAFDVHNDNCQNCHINTGSDGSLHAGDAGNSVAGGTSYGTAVYPTHTIGTTSTCSDCHASHSASFTTGHQNEDHLNLVLAPLSCTGCHEDAMIDGADTHVNECTYCHVNTDTDGRLVAGGTGTANGDVGDARVHTWGSTSSCVDCHENGSTYTYLSDYGGANGHQVMDHDGITGTTSGTPIYDCNNCHAAATKIQIAETTHTACSNCHNSSGDLVGAVTNGTTLNHVMGQTSNCVECHGVSGGDYDTNFENHIYANDTTDHIAPPDSGSTVFQLAGTDEISGTKCDACHGSTLTDWANVYDLHNVGAGACATCHNSTRDYDTDDGGSVQTVIHDNNQSTNPCISCHYSYRLDHSDHVATGWVYGNAECTGCHDQAGAADQDQYIVVLHNNSCDMCHTDSGNSDYTLKVGTSAYGHDLGTTNTCSDCHDGSNGQLNYAGDFTLHTAQNHTWVGSNIECSECHTGDIVNLDAAFDVHNDNCQNCHINTGSDGSLHAGDAGNSVAGGTSYGTAVYPTHTIGTTSTCSDCHASHSASFTTGHQNEDHLNLVLAPTSCTGCHDGAMIDGGTSTHSNQCTYCHVNTDTDGRLVDGLTGTAAGNVGDATVHTWGSTSSCADCHGSHDASFTTGHGNDETHATLLDSTDCTGCHEDAMIDGADTHINECTYCHVSTDSDGSLVAGGTGTANGDVGDAQVHTWGSTSSCVACHENGGTYTYLSDYGGVNGHKVEDHDGLTGTTSGTQTLNCNGCHAAATKLEIAETTHTACSNCHNSSGALAGARPNGTTVGHAIGSTSNCADCHSNRAGDFAAHDHADTTNHASDGTGTTIAQNGSDICVDKPCSDCHVGSLDNFGDVYDTHNTATNGSGACATCHNSTRSNATTPGSIQTGNGDASVQDVIANATYTEASKAYCLLCHDNKDTSHGGHSNGDFAWDANCKDCHGPDTLYVVQDVHGGTCIMCHSSALGSASNEDIGSTTYGVDGDARLADGDSGSYTSTCTTCHPQNGNSGGAEPFNTWVQTHHDDSPSNYSASGDCDLCHTDPRPNYSGGVNIAYKQLACVNCHVVDDLSGGIKAVSNLLKDPGDNADSTRANNTQVDIAGHAWPNTPLATGIKNYGSCFNCHGETGFNAGRASKVTVPLHALPTPTDINTGAEVGLPNERDGNEIGGGGWQIDCWSGTKGVYGTWSINGSAEGCSGADFRGGEGVVSAKWTNSYFPLGKTTINIAWGAYALPKKATNNTEYKENVGTLVGHTKFNIPQGLKWGYVADIQHDNNNWYVIPIFDTDPVNDLGVDTLSQVTTFSVNWTGTTGPIDTRTITVNVESDDLGATLYLVYGGHVLASGTTPLNTTVDLDVEAESGPYGVGTASKGSLYASPNPGIIWVVSDKGGSITLSGDPDQGQGHD